ncbi:unnamed protein product, partial [Vitis vinifera]|uniref:Uncharacterized protein n=1 Tax=Vitis vinifera TaxID=29760 RepID=D7TH94_VITVI
MPKEMEADWLLPLKEKLGLLGPTSSTPSISKFPNKLPRLKEEVYSPQIVSIGPYHHGKADLLDMEEHKLQYGLSRTNNTIETLMIVLRSFKICTKEFVSAMPII